MPGGLSETRGILKFWEARSNFAPLDARVIRVRLRFPAPDSNSWDIAFDPDLRYNLSLAMDSTPFNQEGGNGRAALQDAYVSSWHIPWATVQVGQQRVWFNRALISSNRHVNVRGQHDRAECVRLQPSEQSRYRDQHPER